jgi:hypothetical protein
VVVMVVMVGDEDGGGSSDGSGGKGSDAGGGSDANGSGGDGKLYWWLEVCGGSPGWWWEFCEVQASTGTHCNEDSPLLRANKAHRHRSLHSDTKIASSAKNVFGSIVS